MPAISVDTKKKELVGLLRQPGAAWSQASPGGRDPDFPSDAQGRAMPYGLYDLHANSDGSNGCRPRAWKHALQHTFCNPRRLRVTVARYLSGSSQWNPTEHRLFSLISPNWAVGRWPASRRS